MRHLSWLVGAIALCVGLGIGEEVERRKLRPVTRASRMNDPEFVRRSNRGRFIVLAVISALLILVGLLEAI